MARIRTIKPEFFTSEDIVSLSPLARLFYVSLWCEADREGRLAWKPKTLKLRYLPGDECSVEHLASELVSAKLVVLYEVDGALYAEIPSFTKHQVINNREQNSQIPSRVAHASTTRASRVKAEGREGRKGKECSELSDDIPDDMPTAPPAPPVVSLPLVDKTDFDVSSEMVEGWSDAFPAVDVLQQLKAMRAWCAANPRQLKTRAGIERFVTQWLTKEQNRGGIRPRGVSDEPMHRGFL